TDVSPEIGLNLLIHSFRAPIRLGVPGGAKKLLRAHRRAESSPKPACPVRAPVRNDRPRESMETDVALEETLRASIGFDARHRFESNVLRKTVLDDQKVGRPIPARRWEANHKVHSEVAARSLRDRQWFKEHLFGS